MKSSMKKFTSDMRSLQKSIRPLTTVSSRFRESKKSIALAIILVIFTATGSYAQSFHWGLKAGTNLFKVSGRSMDGKVQAGLSAGAFAELNLNSKWGLQPELLFNQTQTNTSADFNAIYQGASFTGVQLNYISLPVLVAYKPVPELTLLLGPQYGYLVNQTTGLLPQQPNKDAFKKSDLDIVFGAQLNLGKFRIGARYSVGATNINGINDSDVWKNQGGFQFHLGYRLM
jgi:outer membrane protein with beta-barrel domain